MFQNFLDDSPGYKHNDPDFALFEDLYSPRNEDRLRSASEGEKP